MIVQVLRTYDGAEGRRVKPGTRFAIAGSANPEGLQVITLDRFRAMSQRSIPLMKEFKAEEAAAAPGKQKPSPDPKTKVIPDGKPSEKPPASKPIGNAQFTRASKARTEAGAKTAEPRRQRAKQETPGRPRPLANPAAAPSGSPGGTEAQLSSSQAAPAPRAPRSGPRGTRKSGGSQSTTPTG